MATKLDIFTSGLNVQPIVTEFDQADVLTKHPGITKRIKI